MSKLYSVQISVEDCTKEISVYCEDVTLFKENIDILTTSAFVDSYCPTPRTVFKALYDKGISVECLAADPEIDLRNPCHVWLSKELSTNSTTVKRVGCIELLGAQMYRLYYSEMEQAMINSIRAYFQMLDIASIYGVKMSSIALPLLGSGSQRIPSKLLIIPLFNECISFLKRNRDVERILFIEKDSQKANFIADSLKQSSRFLENTTTKDATKKRDYVAFISYSTPDKNIADNLCFKLESKGIKVWYAPRDSIGPYAEAIANAIDRATHFIVILSQNSMYSEHVLNEIDLAFQRLPSNIKFKPLRIDNTMFTPSFKYYLSRQHWMDASDPPLEERLKEFVDTLLEESGQNPQAGII